MYNQRAIAPSMELAMLFQLTKAKDSQKGLAWLVNRLDRGGRQGWGVGKGG